MHEKPRILRRTLIWMAVAAFAIGSAFAFEHTSHSGGVMLDSLTLAKNDGSCEKDHQGPDSKPNCVSCTDEHGKTHNCKQPCTHGPNEDPKKNCVPCTDKHGKPKECKPCNGTDEHGNPKPKHCVVSDDGSVTSEEGTTADG
jgi:hypothetical protein